VFRTRRPRVPTAKFRATFQEKHTSNRRTIAAIRNRGPRNLLSGSTRVSERYLETEIGKLAELDLEISGSSCQLMSMAMGYCPAAFLMCTRLNYRTALEREAYLHRKRRLRGNSTHPDNRLNLRTSQIRNQNNLEDLARLTDLAAL
jgi:hypothetical protein